jgi:serine-type D-Ala-D-Ala carboxypeptidase/endopeptidase
VTPPGAADPAALFAERAAFVPGSAIAWGTLRDGETVTGSTNPVLDPCRYQIGSVTKLFTGSLLALFVRRGLVRLDTRIGELIEVPLAADVAAITLRELATHTSGLPQLPQKMHAPNVADPYATFDREALIGFVAALQNGSIVDGRGTFDYSNFGASVLGTLLAIADGRSYEELLADELFGPLGMRDSSVAAPPDDPQIYAGMNADGETTPGWTFGAFAPCGGVVSTAADLLLFVRALCDGRSALAEALRDATIPHAPVRDAGLVGLCWMCEDTLRWHNGQTFAHHAMIAVDLATATAAVGLWNASAALDDVCFHLVRPARELAVLPVELPLAADALVGYEGIYEKQYGGTLTIVADQRSLIVDDGAGLCCRLYLERAAANEATFFSKRIPNHAFVFELDAAGEALGLEQRFAGVVAALRARRRRP